jgi:hypothetical protein
MQKILIVLFCSFLVFACASGQAGLSFSSNEGKQTSFTSSKVWNTHPANGQLVLIGAAGRQQRKEDAVTLALKDAAKKAAFFYGIYGRTETFVQTGVSYYDFDLGKSIEFVYDENYVKYIDQFEFDAVKDVFEEEDSVFVRVRFKGGSVPPVNFKPTAAGTIPEWIKRPPRDFNGYSVGVGFAPRHSYYKDAIIASYEAAAASILNKVHGKAGSSYESQETEGYVDLRTMDTQFAEGFLTDFYVLETWLDPNDKSVWTLAIARNGGE